MKKILRGYYDYEKACWVPRFIENTAIKFPSLFPSYEKVDKLAKELKSLETIATENGKRVKLPTLITQLIQNEELYKHFKFENNSNTLNIKFGGDGFWLTNREKTVNFYLTFLNLGELVHSPDFVWVAVTYSGDEEYKIMKTNVEEVLMEMEMLTKEGIDIILW